MTNSNLTKSGFKIFLISLPFLTLSSLTSVNSNHTMRQLSTEPKGFTRWTHLGDMMSVTVLSQKEPQVSQFVCDSQNFFGYEKRRVGGNIPEDCSILMKDTLRNDTK